MYESLTSEYTVGILLQCVFYIVGKTQYQLHVHVHMYCSIDACGQLQSTVPAAMYCASCSCTSECQLPVLYQLRQSRLPVHVHKAASTKAASTKLYQLLTSGCQLVSSGCQLVSSGCQLTVQRMSANFQNKAVSKYFWNMYQLMSAAVHVLRYVLYQRIPDARFA